VQHVDVGEPWPIESRWWDANGDPAEPSAITLTIDPPTGATITKNKGDLTGSAQTEGDATLDTWRWLQAWDEAGVWRYTFLGTVDGNPVTESGMFLVGEVDASEGPCEPWVEWADVVALCPSTPNLSTLVPGQIEYLLDVASWTLWALSGKRYPGICSTTRRICRACFTCGGWCVCGVRDTIDLGSRWPVYGVWDVTVDGDTVPAASYSLRAHRWLDRIDGESWPASGDVTDPDAFTISYAYGRRPPVGLVHAAAVFAAEMAKKCVGSVCAIPERVTNITREGVSYTILDAQRFLDEGRTGVYAVDLALISDREAREDVRPGGYSPMSGGYAWR
jgi:hypothetical protein